jgi:hypothetical protein
MKLTTKYQTVRTTGYTHPVARNENPAAHGGVCHLQVKMGPRGPLSRLVNVNQHHVETGPSRAATGAEMIVADAA